MKFLTANDIEAIRANRLPAGSETPAAQVAAVADARGYVLFTKDEDFRTSYLLRRTPRKLVYIRTGNGLRDQALLKLLGRHLNDIKRLAAH